MPDFKELLLDKPKNWTVGKLKSAWDCATDAVKIKNPGRTAAAVFASAVVVGPAFTGGLIEFSNALSKKPAEECISGIEVAKSAYKAEAQVVVGMIGYFQDISSDMPPTSSTHHAMSGSQP